MPFLRQKTKVLGSFVLIAVVAFAAFTALAKMPKQAQKMLQKKYVKKEAEIIVDGIPARMATTEAESGRAYGGGDYSSGSGGRPNIIVQYARVEIRDGRMGLKDPKAKAEFGKGNFVTIKALRFKKDHIKVIIRDLGRNTVEMRGATLKIYTEREVINTGNIDEISALIDAWLNLR